MTGAICFLRWLMSLKRLKHEWKCRRNISQETEGDVDYGALIERAAKAKRPLYELSNDVFILGPTASFSGWEEDSFSLITDIATFFSISVRSVHFCGSAKLGFSPVKLRAFVEGKSDLDVAILDSHCFRGLHEEVLIETNQMRDRTKFSWISRGGVKYSGYDEFIKYLSRGILRPDLMPNIQKKADIRTFFHNLSLRHRGKFKSVSACIYLSDVAFKLKQAGALQAFVEQKGFI